ncbi:hypothetical protein NADFUDRAFT_70491 [Nadsonia fulvescens var. elongata DSM 6958]|uniref:Nucleoside phosphatase GDA1/CD39 n=1 Tax=Nadsonia fulvescens var. elongata DSM 6958 TaxID=857566 RepID=A0A1E3PJ70_9ASCO|nr:hypothetical protein NADFUDRAFT_70491 [Nadsonia fulvescens var. elongata DSM 6958]
MKPIASSDSNYGIVIDAGSSGSRIHVYQWANPEKTQKKLLHKNKGGEEYNRQSKGELAMLPEIIHKKDWNKKTSPGISSFGYKYEGKTSKKELKKFAEDLWENHLEDLVEFAEKIIPDKNDQLNTPIFLLATAGMRLLKPKDQTKILNTSCHLLKKKTHFKIPECENHVDVINGDTEGLYGWLALNYLLDQFNGNSQSEKQRNSFGFMDMGGASTQIAFLPSEKESIRHFDDLYKINLRTLDGKDLASDIFVSSWLGFGANEARRRHFENLKKQQKPQLLNPDDYDFEIEMVITKNALKACTLY